MTPSIQKSTTTIQPPQFTENKMIGKLIRDYIEDQAQTAAHEKEIQKTQKKVGCRIVEAISLIALSYFFCLAFDEQADFISKWMAIYIPIIEKLRSGTEIGMLPANFFSIGIVLGPMLAIRIGWGVDFLTNIKHAAAYKNVSTTTLYIFLLVCVLPFFLYIVSSVLLGDLPTLKEDGGRCGNCTYWMINSYLTLFIIGGITIYSYINLFCVLLIILIWTPILALKKYFAKGN
jgi:hypothetical protein